MKKFRFLRVIYLLCCPSYLRQKALCCFWWFEFPLLRCGSNGMVPSHHGSCFWKGGWRRSSFVWAVIFQGTFNLVQFFQHGFQTTQLSECQNLGFAYIPVIEISFPSIIYLFIHSSCCLLSVTNLGHFPSCLIFHLLIRLFFYGPFSH